MRAVRILMVYSGYMYDPSYCTISVKSDQGFSPKGFTFTRDQPLTSEPWSEGGGDDFGGSVDVDDDSNPPRPRADKPLSAHEKVHGQVVGEDSG